MKKEKNGLSPREFRSKAAFTILGFVISITYSFPILYMFLSAFKTEYTIVPPSLIFTPTLETFAKIFAVSSIWRSLQNSVFIVIFSVLCSMALGVACAYALLFAKFKTRETSGKIYYWFVTTFLLPPVAVILPVYIIFNRLGILGNHWSMIFIYTGFHIPMVIWMTHPAFSGVPREIAQAADIDGCSKFSRFFLIILPMVKNGIVSAALLIFIFLWNEYFFAFNLTANTQATLPVYMARFSEQYGMFWAQLCASATISILPAVLIGFLSQKSLAKGLALGAVKG